MLRYERPWQQLAVQYAQSRGKIWTEEEDAYLVNMMNRFGYGNWERIRVEIRNAWQSDAARQSISSLAINATHRLNPTQV